MDKGLVSLISQLGDGIPEQRDRLTGLLQRNYLEDYSGLLLEQVRKWAVPMTFAMIDLDLFKRINDCYGHEKGDSVLKGIGKCIDEAIRDWPTAKAARWGGEEFAVAYLAENGMDHEVPDAIRDAMHSSRPGACCMKGDKHEVITASIGYSTFYPDDDLVDANGKSIRMTLLKKIREEADHALFYSKFKGGDQANRFSEGLNIAYNEAMIFRRYIAGLCDCFQIEGRIESFENYPLGLTRIDINKRIPVDTSDLKGMKKVKKKSIHGMIADSLNAIIERRKFHDTRFIYDEADRIYHTIQRCDPGYISFEKEHLAKPVYTPL